MNDDMPLVSVCFTCYNRKNLVAKAFESILAQTYEPLEIVVSDNSSTDGTSEILTNLIDRYKAKGGRHSIVYKRNDVCIRGTDNITQCYRMAHGILIISAHDDDVSYPYRVERIVKFCLSREELPMAVMHDAYKVDLSGKRIGVVEKRSWESPLGAVAVYNKKVFDFHPENVPNGCMTDIIFPRVAGLIGDVCNLPEKLLDYTIGAGTSPLIFGSRGKAIWFSQSDMTAALYLLDFIEDQKRNITQERYKLWKGRFRKLYDDAKAWNDLVEGKSLSTRLVAYKKRNQRVFSVMGLQDLAYLVSRGFLGDALICGYNFINIARKVFLFWCGS